MVAAALAPAAELTEPDTPAAADEAAAAAEPVTPEPEAEAGAADETERVAVLTAVVETAGTDLFWIH